MPNKPFKRKNERFIQMSYHMLNSPAWQNLASNARCILIAFLMRYNGCNNGSITMSVRQAAEVLKGSKSTAQKALRALVDNGFIKLVNKGHMGNKHASTWLLTMRKDDRNGYPPTNDWRSVPALQKTNDSTSRGTVSTPTRTIGVNIHEDSTTTVPHQVIH